MLSYFCDNVRIIRGNCSPLSCQLEEIRKFSVLWFDWRYDLGHTVFLLHISEPLNKNNDTIATLSKETCTLFSLKYVCIFPVFLRVAHEKVVWSTEGLELLKQWNSELVANSPLICLLFVETINPITFAIFLGIRVRFHFNDSHRLMYRNFWFPQRFNKRKFKHSTPVPRFTVWCSRKSNRNQNT